jgi:hypothetical protein
LKSFFNGKKDIFLRPLYKSPKKEKRGVTKQRGNGLSLAIPHSHKVSSPGFIILLRISPFGSRENVKENCELFTIQLQFQQTKKKKKKKEEKKGGEIFHFLAFSPQPNGFDFSLWPSKLTSVCKP